MSAVGASPRERRNRFKSLDIQRFDGRISARAEEPDLFDHLRVGSAAHLRASGGTRLKKAVLNRLKGASPRERRNLRKKPLSPVTSRRISARAEEPKRIALLLGQNEAHLRASGGTEGDSIRPTRGFGASPRERRNRDYDHSRDSRPRRISARAEEPRRSTAEKSRGKAHLRASGGTPSPSCTNSTVIGASPRERRNLPLLLDDRAIWRRISARAEEPATQRSHVACLEAHLRASGGTPNDSRRAFPFSGASPRERRNRARRCAMNGYERRISARAEEPGLSVLRCGNDGAHLRASGGTEAIKVTAQVLKGASPRERRNPRTQNRRALHRRRISARAEEPRGRKEFRAL